MAAIASAVVAVLLSGGHDVSPTVGREISLSAAASIGWAEPVSRLCSLWCDIVASSSITSVIAGGGSFDDCDILARVMDGPVCFVVCMVVGWPCCIVVCRVIGTCVSAVGFTVVTPVLWFRASVL